MIAIMGREIMNAHTHSCIFNIIVSKWIERERKRERERERECEREGEREKESLREEINGMPFLTQHVKQKYAYT